MNDAIVPTVENANTQDNNVLNNENETNIKTSENDTQNNQNQMVSDDVFANALKEVYSNNDIQAQKTDNQPPAEENKTVQKEEDLEEGEELLKEDKNLLKYETLVKAGFSNEEALEKVYGEYKADFTQKAAKDVFGEPQFEIADWVKNTTEQDYQVLKEAYKNPTDQNLLYHLQKDPELRADFKNLDVDNLKSLDIYEDAAANNMFRRVLKESYRKTIGGFINEIEKAQNLYAENVKVRTNLIQDLEDDFLKDYPELASDDIKSVSLAKHFVDRFRQKFDLLSPKQQEDIDLIKKLYQAAKAEYKTMYPVLKKRLGFLPEKQIENAQLQNKKLNEMQQNGSIPTGMNSEEGSFMLGANSSDDDFAKALISLTAKK